ncbi:alpha/beta hydrolase family protein [Pseudalkalibacillus caeni]|nr:hypothetical protein [Pseudalkalibacillus caeni]
MENKAEIEQQDQHLPGGKNKRKLKTEKLDSLLASLISFGNRTWRGAAVGAASMFILVIVSIGFGINTGLGKSLDTGIYLVVGILGLLIGWGLLYIGIKLLKKMKTAFLAAAVISVILTIYTLDQFRSLNSILVLSYTLVGIGIVAGGSLGYVKSKGLRNASSFVFLFIFLTVTASFFFWLLTPGYNPYPVNAGKEIDPIPLLAENPSKTGAFTFKTLTYGSGDDKQRVEFGEKVDLKVDPINAFRMIDGWDKKRTWFWGFDETNIPLNGRVWIPDGIGKFPLVLMVHGNHKMEEFSDTGYNYLGTLLASRGFIAVSVDENFLNSSWSGSLNNEINARAWLLLKHIQQLEKFNQTSSSPLSNKIDMENIALMGHSRGGQAVALAALFNKLPNYPNNGSVSFDFNYNINSIIAIAPTDYHKIADKDIKLENINYLLLHGSYDSDVSEFSGDRQFEDITFTADGDWFKTSLYIHGANHGQFNTVWGDDTSFPFNLLINKEPLISGDEQRQIAKTYISSFLESTLKGKQEYKPIFQDYRYALNWMPEKVYINRYSDNSIRLLSDYEEDIDITTGTIEGVEQTGKSLSQWYENELEYRRNFERKNHGVFIKWNETYSDNGRYIVSLPEANLSEINFTEDSSVTFSVANLGVEENDTFKGDSVDFSIKLTSKNGASATLPLHTFGKVPPVLQIQHTKTKFYQDSRYGEKTEPVLQSFVLPLKNFKLENSRFDPKQLTKVTFLFNKSKKGKIIIDDIGIRP